MASPHRTRDSSSLAYDLSESIYGMFPTRSPPNIIRRSCSTSPPSPKSSTNNGNNLTIKLSRTMSPAWFHPPKPLHHHLHQYHQQQQIDLHQSTCLNLARASTDSAESDLWILPDFEDWAADAETPEKEVEQSDMAPLLSRAATSNRERLRARLEGDGWDFVGGKFGEEKGMGEGGECVDEEFDVVVVRAEGC